MIKVEWMSNEATKGYAVGLAYNTRVHTLWVMCGFFMVVVGKGG